MRTIIKKIEIYWQAITAILILSLLAATIIHFNTPTLIRSTTFLSIGANDREFTNTFFNFEASDNFAETIMGWFRNPAFQSKINESTQNSLRNLTVKKIEKLNLSISFDQLTSENLNQNQQILNQQILSEINKYNQTTNANFTAKTDQFTTQTIKPNLIYNLLFALISTIFLSAFFIIIYELTTGVIISQSSVETISTNFTSIKKSELTNLTQILSTHQLINLTTQKLPIKTQPPEKLSTINPNQPLILLCEISKTKLNLIKLINALNPNQIGIIFIY